MKRHHIPDGELPASFARPGSGKRQRYLPETAFDKFNGGNGVKNNSNKNREDKMSRKSEITSVPMHVTDFCRIQIFSV